MSSDEVFIMSNKLLAITHGLRQKELCVRNKVEIMLREIDRHCRYNIIKYTIFGTVKIL